MARGVDDSTIEIDLTDPENGLKVKDGGIGDTQIGTLNHDALTGLADDDHAQYILHSLADAANDFLVASGNDTIVKKTLAETGAILEGDINHDNLQGFASNEHFTEASIDHSGINDDEATKHRLINDSAGNGATTELWSADKIFDQLALKVTEADVTATVATHNTDQTGVHGITNTGLLLDTGDVDDTPVNGATTAPVSSNWAYDHENDSLAHSAAGGYWRKKAIPVESFPITTGDQTATSANSLGGKVVSTPEPFEVKFRLHEDWDGASDILVDVICENSDDENTTAGNGFAILANSCYYKGDQEIVNRSQTFGTESHDTKDVNGLWELMKPQIVIDYNPGGGNNVAAGDWFSLNFAFDDASAGAGHEIEEVVIVGVVIHYKTTNPAEEV